MWSKLRLKYGMFWTTHKPPMPWKHLAVIVLCVLTYGGVVRIDNLSERVKEMEHVNESNATYAELLFTCMSAGINNEVGGFYLRDAGKAFECAIREI